jgi:hypothetical protein
MRASRDTEIENAFLMMMMKAYILSVSFNNSLFWKKENQKQFILFIIHYSLL